METHNLYRKKVFGGIQRLLHAWIALTVLGLVAMGWAGKFMDPGSGKLALSALHITLGYGLLLGLVLRIVWGFVGPEEARLFRQSKNNWGHEPLASISYLLFYFGLGLACLSGLLLAAIQYDRGIFAARLFDDFTWHEIITSAHDLVFYAVTVFILLHIGALIFHEKERGYPLAQAMLSGYQYRPSSSEITHHEKAHSVHSDTDG
jgi:cytochrome b561